MFNHVWHRLRRFLPILGREMFNAGVWMGLFVLMIVGGVTGGIFLKNFVDSLIDWMSHRIGWFAAQWAMIWLILVVIVMSYAAYRAVVKYKKQYKSK